ncbi:MAG: endolytic transglycosylase MltG [Halocynthiibacter sp.]
MWKHIASTGLTLLFLALVGASVVILWGKSQYQAEGPLEATLCYRVDAGSTMRKTSKGLEDKGAIRNGTVFRLGAEYADKSSKLKAGSYLIPAHATMAEITDIVTRGGASSCGSEIQYRIGVTRAVMQLREFDNETGGLTTSESFNPIDEETPQALTKALSASDMRYRITVAEGATVWQIVNALKSASFIKGELTELPKEGTLAPWDYEVKSGDTIAALVDRMAKRQTDTLDALWETRAEGLPVKTKEEALILASIVEKETGVAEERPLVASVFTNRLNRGIKLQTDPTVIYGVTKGQGTLGRGIRRSELRKKTPWNTYVIDGLPVTPIANPGKKAIEAALNPATSNFIFFVADGTGGHAFAETLNEHNQNVTKWRAIEKEKNKAE